METVLTVLVFLLWIIGLGGYIAPVVVIVNSILNIITINKELPLISDDLSNVQILSVFGFINVLHIVLIIAPICSVIVLITNIVYRARAKESIIDGCLYGFLFFPILTNIACAVIDVILSAAALVIFQLNLTGLTSADAARAAGLIQNGELTCMPFIWAILIINGINLLVKIIGKIVHSVI